MTHLPLSYIKKLKPYSDVIVKWMYNLLSDISCYWAFQPEKTCKPLVKALNVCYIYPDCVAESSGGRVGLLDPGRTGTADQPQWVWGLTQLAAPPLCPAAMVMCLWLSMGNAPSHTRSSLLWSAFCHCILCIQHLHQCKTCPLQLNGDISNDPKSRTIHSTHTKTALWHK